MKAFLAIGALGLAAGLATPGPALAEGMTLLGLKLGTDYIAGAMSQNAEKPAVSGFIEHTFANGLYGGVWFSQIDYSAHGMDDSFEIDIYAGLRGAFGKLGYDLGYFRYYYEDYGFDYDEWILDTKYGVTERLNLGIKLKKAGGGRYEDGFMYGPTFGYALTEKFYVSGSATANTVDDRRIWDIGVSRSLTDETKAELRYYDSTDGDPLLVASVSWMTRIFGGN